MPRIRPIAAIGYRLPADSDISRLIAPPYDVLDAQAKAKLLQADANNIVAVDLPHLPAKTVGPDVTYQNAGRMFRQWLESEVLQLRPRPAMFAYRQTYTARKQTFKRMGLIANVQVQPLGKSGGIHPHEQTFSGAKIDRLKLMQATGVQLSPIFGIFPDEKGAINHTLEEVVAGDPTFYGRTAGDDVLHQVWAIDDKAIITNLSGAFTQRDIFIADGHHRYHTALNYVDALRSKEGRLAEDHPANSCMFVLIAMEDPGMIVLPTHRVLGGMPSFDSDLFKAAAHGQLHIKSYPGSDLAALESALVEAGPHAVGLYHPADIENPMAIATTVTDDPLADDYPDASSAWRQLDVAIIQHLIVEKICQPHFCKPSADPPQVVWKFPHTLDEVKQLADTDEFQLGVIVQPTPLEAVRQISDAGELMPQKSTFFYPKLASGLVINPLTYLGDKVC